MKLVWRDTGVGVIRLKRYVGDQSFQWAGKVFKALPNDPTWTGQIHQTGEYQSFNSKAEAQAWVEVVVRMRGR